MNDMSEYNRRLIRFFKEISSFDDILPPEFIQKLNSRIEKISLSLDNTYNQLILLEKNIDIKNILEFREYMNECNLLVNPLFNCHDNNAEHFLHWRLDENYKKAKRNYEDNYSKLNKFLGTLYEKKLN